MCLRKPQSLWAASVMSTPNLTAKKGRDCGHTDATSTLCFDASHFWQGQRKVSFNKCNKAAQKHSLVLEEVYLIQSQNSLHFLQTLLRDLQGVLVWQTAVTGQTCAQQKLGAFIHLKKLGDFFSPPNNLWSGLRFIFLYWLLPVLSLLSAKSILICIMLK